MADTDQAFVGRCKNCGKLHAASVLTPSTAPEISKSVKEWKKAGLTVEQMTVAEARPELDLVGCDEAED